MPTLSEPIGRAITPEAKYRNKPTIVTLSGPVHPITEKAHRQYEADLFNILLADFIMSEVAKAAVPP